MTELVCARLVDCGYPYRLLDFGNYPAGFRIKWHWQRSGVSGYFAGPDWKLDLDELTGVYVRYLGLEGRAPPPNIEPTTAPAIYFEYDTGLMVLLEDLHCVVVNRLAGGMSNNSKVYQALLVRQCGLLTPPTLVTNDAKAAHRFYEDHQGEVVYKSLSGIRSIVRRLEPGQLARLSLLRHGPAQFQSFSTGRECSSAHYRRPVVCYTCALGGGGLSLRKPRRAQCGDGTCDTTTGCRRVVPAARAPARPDR